jgi:hypothetical protein
MRCDIKKYSQLGLLRLCFVLLSLGLTLNTALAKDMNANPEKPEKENQHEAAPVQSLPYQEFPPLTQAAPPQPQGDLSNPNSQPEVLPPLTTPAPEANSGSPVTQAKPNGKMTAMKETGKQIVKKASKVLSKAPLGKPVGQVLIFPVLPQTTAKAFGDLPILFSDEFAAELMHKAAPIQVHNPVYTLEEIKAQGLESTYRKIMEYYVRAHRPEPKALSFLLSELKDTLGNAPIDRVVFVESDFDINYMTKATRLTDRVKQWTTDGIPKDSSYYLRSRIQVFDTSQAEMPMVWGNTWSGVVHGDQFYNMTPSVFHDSDSRMAFSKTSRWMSRQLMLTMSPLVLHHPYDAASDQNVQGKLAP